LFWDLHLRLRIESDNCRTFQARRGWGDNWDNRFGKCCGGLPGIRFVFVLAGALWFVCFFYGSLPLCNWEVRLSNHPERARAKDVRSTFRRSGRDPKVCGARPKAVRKGVRCKTAAENTAIVST
jgi:hypothetical protein